MREERAERLRVDFGLQVEPVGQGETSPAPPVGQSERDERGLLNVVAMTSTPSPDYLALLTAGADIALTAPQPKELLLSLAATASNRGRLTIHRAELVDAELLRMLAERAAGHVTLQFSHTDDSPHEGG